MAEAARETRRTADQVLKEAGELSQQSETLRSGVSLFLDQVRAG